MGRIRRLDGIGFLPLFSLFTLVIIVVVSGVLMVATSGAVLEDYRAECKNPVSRHPPTPTPPIPGPYLNVSTPYLNLTFDLEHGGILMSIRYAGREMLTGESGRWNSIDFVKQFMAPSGGDVCIEWGSLLKYQYDEGNAAGNVTVTDTKKDKSVDVRVGLGTLSWQISKHAPLLSLTVTPEPGLLPYYLYIPLAKENATLDIHTTPGGWHRASDTIYCNSTYNRSTLVKYWKQGGRGMIVGSSRPVPVAYYGLATENTWLLHYPVPPAGSYLLRFYFHHKKQS